jgi:hypothetical protein
MHAHLGELATALEAGSGPLDDEQAEPLVLVLAGADDGDDEVGVEAVGDEGLGTVDDVVVAVADRWCGCRTGPIRRRAPSSRWRRSSRRWPGSQRAFCSSLARLSR